MSKKFKNIAIIIMFATVLGVISIGNLARPVKPISFTERRKLAQPPDFTRETLLDGSFFAALDGFFADQFIFREDFRRAKAIANYEVFRRLDNNGIAIAQGSAIKLETELRSSAVAGAASKLNSLYEDYFSGMNVFCAVIPEKNYYLAASNGYPALDYDKLVEILGDSIRAEIAYIDIFAAMDGASFYSTDPHWRQEALSPLLNALAAAMSFDPADVSAYEQVQLSPFYGAYYGHSALPMKPDVLVYLESGFTRSATAFNYEMNSEIPVYSPELFSGVDPYDVYLSGASPLIVIESPLCESGKELILFRDSFGSSLAPLLLESYSKITMIDTRYMASALIGRLVEIKGSEDVLFLYSASVINNSEMLK